MPTSLFCARLPLNSLHILLPIMFFVPFTAPTKSSPDCHKKGERFSPFLWWFWHLYVKTIPELYLFIHYEKYSLRFPNFENIELEKNNLLVANFSIPFCNKEYFYEFWNKISNSILAERILRWEFFWIKWFLGKDKRANGLFIKRASIGII